MHSELGMALGDHGTTPAERARGRELVRAALGGFTILGATALAQTATEWLKAPPAARR